MRQTLILMVECFLYFRLLGTSERVDVDTERLDVDTERLDVDTERLQRCGARNVIGRKLKGPLAAAAR